MIKKILLLSCIVSLCGAMNNKPFDNDDLFKAIGAGDTEKALAIINKKDFNQDDYKYQLNRLKSYKLLDFAIENHGEELEDGSFLDSYRIIKALFNKEKIDKGFDYTRNGAFGLVFSEYNTVEDHDTSLKKSYLEIIKLFLKKQVQFSDLNVLEENGDGNEYPVVLTALQSICNDPVLFAELDSNTIKSFKNILNEFSSNSLKLCNLNESDLWRVTSDKYNINTKKALKRILLTQQQTDVQFNFYNPKKRTQEIGKNNTIITSGVKRLKGSKSDQ